MSITLSLNGVPTVFHGQTVSDLLSTHTPQPPFAVAVNTSFVAKSHYETTELKEGDKVDIVRPVVGG